MVRRPKNLFELAIPVMHNQTAEHDHPVTFIATHISGVGFLIKLTIVKSKQPKPNQTKLKTESNYQSITMTSFAARYYLDFTPLATNPHLYDQEVKQSVNKKADDDKKLGASKVTAERSPKVKRHHSK